MQFSCRLYFEVHEGYYGWFGFSRTGAAMFCLVAKVPTFHAIKFEAKLAFVCTVIPFSAIFTLGRSDTGVGGTRALRLQDGDKLIDLL